MLGRVKREHYVYAHFRESDGALFYIGKGKAGRAWQKNSRNRRWRFIVAKHGFTVSVIKDCLPEHCALSLERIVISANRYLDLANYTDGGGGTTGWRHSAEAKAKIGKHWKGRKINDKQRKALDEARSNRVISDETRRRMSDAAKRRTGRVVSPETRAKIAASHIGLRPSDESRRKMSLSKIGKAVGKDSPTYDHTVREFCHPEHGHFLGTRAELIEKYKLNSSCMSALIKGRRATVKGWRLK